METEKLQVNMATGQTELIIREGEAPKLLPILAPVKVNISGTLNAVCEFLVKRVDQADQINQKRCHVVVNREEITLTLKLAENDPYLNGTVKGKLELHPKFEEFGINSKKNWDPNELGQFFKMNRAFFPDKSKNMSLVTELKNFEANIDAKRTKQNNETGSFADNYSAIVTSNLPDTFSLNIPIFKGVPAEIIEIEFYATVSGKEISLQLFSPGANQLTEELRDKAIDGEIEIIKTVCPDMAIIEE